MGFRKGNTYGIKPNAEHHKKSRYILKIDIKDFFPSIRRKKVYPIFKGLGYSQFVSNVFINFCMLNGSLPQGASTSPYLSNLVFKETDSKIFDFCNNEDAIYTRYADDLVFSCNNKTTLKQLLPSVKQIIEKEGFSINNDKTALLTPKHRKIVTGLVINSGEVRVKRQLRHNARSMIFNDIIKGGGDLSKKTKGYLSFIRQVEEETYNKLQRYAAQLIILKYKISAAPTTELK